MKYRIDHKVLKVIMACSLHTTFINSALQEKINAALVTIDSQINQTCGIIAGSGAVIEELARQNKALQQALLKAQQPSPASTSSSHNLIMQQNEKLRQLVEKVSGENKKLQEERNRFRNEWQQLVERCRKAEGENQQLRTIVVKLTKK